jgi:hypothetical protein
MHKTDANPSNPTLKSLYRIGGVAPLVTLTVYLGQLLIIIVSGVTFPATPESWFALFQQNTLLGLVFLNAFDVFSIAILGLMFLALYFALRETDPSYMVVASFFAFLGIAVFVSTRALMVSGTLNLSGLYAAATTTVQKSQILTAWLTITSPTRATPETTGFLFVAIAGLIISTVILRGKVFNNAIAYVGITGFIITLANQISIIVAPAIATILMPLNGLAWLIWWILVSRKLLQLGKSNYRVLRK